MRRCASKDAGPRRGWIGGSHIDWRRERVAARTLGLEEGWIVRSHIGWGGERSILYKVWKPLPSRCILKTFRENPKGKAQREQYLLAVSLGG